MPREGTGERRPWKVWDASRHRKRQVLAASLEELRDRGRERFGCAKDEPVRLVLEADGTYVDDSDYLNWLPDNTTFLILRPGEHWTKANSQQQRAASVGHPDQHAAAQQVKRTEASPIPRVVCDALNLLEIKHEPPFWKIIDNRGRITLVLHWEQARNGGHVRCLEPVRSAAHRLPSAMSELRIKTTPLSAAEDVITLMSEDGKVVTTIRGDRVESHKAKEKKPYRVAATIKCPVPGVGGGGGERQTCHKADDCEFHCGSLHEEGRSIQNADCSRNKGASPQSKAGHVRFSDQDFCQRGERTENKRPAPPDADGSELDDEPESNGAEDDGEGGGVTTEKMLLLTDQLTAEQRKHLTILDLGVILDRLKAKIIDVERLEREREGPSCFRWLIKATIRGRVLRDLGILYNGNYYSISEDCGLAFAASGFEDDEDRDDPV